MPRDLYLVCMMYIRVQYMKQKKKKNQSINMGLPQGNTMYFSRCFGMAPSSFFSSSHLRENSLSA